MSVFPYVGLGCCWFSSSLREVFLWVLWFSSLLKRPTLSNSNSTRNQIDEEPLCGCATSKSLFIYLFTADEVHQDERLGVLLILVEQVSCRTR